MKAQAPAQTEDTPRSAAARAAVGQAGGAPARADNRPEAIAQRQLADAIRHSSRMAAQQQHLRGMFGEAAQMKGAEEEEERDSGTPATVIQGFFTIGGQKTNDKKMFPETFNALTPDAEKREYVWKYFLQPALAERRVNGELIAEFKEKALDLAMDDTEHSLTSFVRRLTELQEHRTAMAVPLSDRTSPAALPALSGTPELAGKEKHSNAKYQRAGGTEETFSSDDYTKGPARRRRDTQNPTTPTGAEIQTWTKAGVTKSIQSWTCKIPLARHLAGYIWPLVQNSAEGKKWELKFREMDRLIDHRDNEGQSSSITILRKSDDKKMETLERRAYTIRARMLLKAALIADVKHPADQQDVLFYDTLLKADVKAEWQSAGTVFTLNEAYKAAAPGLSMLLTHWRPIIFFDWILAEDVMNNGV